MLQSCNPSHAKIYGNKYDSSLDVSDIAKLVRKDIKNAIKAGELPQLKASVRISRFAGGRSLSVYVKSFAHPVMNPEHYKRQREYPHESREWHWFPRYLPEAKAALETLTAIVEAYNMDGSDTMTDYFHVNFYKTVEFDYDLQESERVALEAGLDNGTIGHCPCGEMAAAVPEDETPYPLCPGCASVQRAAAEATMEPCAIDLAIAALGAGDLARPTADWNF